MEESFLNKSKENLKAAEFLLAHGCYNASANRAYYAAFHATLAALSKTGLNVERLSHEAVQSNFASELIHKRKIYPSHLKSYLLTLQSVRNSADYETLFVSEKVAFRQFKRAKEFVDCVLQEGER